jgi:hypothetical protein
LLHARLTVLTVATAPTPPLQVRSSKHWPPRLMEALQRFIQLQ